MLSCLDRKRGGLAAERNNRSSDDDFGAYKGGVYWTACGLAPPLGKKCQAWGHAVKILGWGHDMVNITTFDNATNSTVHTLCVRSRVWLSAGLFPTTALTLERSQARHRVLDRG